jgi:hypothetical protein
VRVDRQTARLSLKIPSHAAAAPPSLSLPCNSHDVTLLLHFISTGVALGPLSGRTPWPSRESTRARAGTPRPSDVPHRCSDAFKYGPAY